ncbi:DnaA inactivator Hda [Conservatibacter flavescens]|uniref:DnaA regulatory inactivator Hda n=1 Tax=Conservatibacter flavescens TaxID=28161 RepID=A0A2M8S1I2_9PAST|nr:DnaA inactivator Hda [Conservatibacter flavescens]PJG84985.1 DnaA regulatory inactivator Hda [Conservatibacter flavescens]
MREAQLPLPIHQLDDETLDNFYADNNLLLLNSLRSNFHHLHQPFFYLWGMAGSGKTHLLKGISAYFVAQERAAIYVPLDKFSAFSPAVLDNLEQQEAVCLDNLHAVIGKEEWEIALFDLINRIKETNNTLLVMSAEQSPITLPIRLPDLASRLTWGETYQLQPLTEEQKLVVLQQNAVQRGIVLPIETATFLLKRLDRDMATLFGALSQLDKASLQAKRDLTIPFVKEILDL